MLAPNLGVSPCLVLLSTATPLAVLIMLHLHMPWRDSTSACPVTTFESPVTLQTPEPHQPACARPPPTRALHPAVQVEDPLQLLLLDGRSCKLHRNAEQHAALERGDGLIPWNGAQVGVGTGQRLPVGGVAMRGPAVAWRCVLSASFGGC